VRVLIRSEPEAFRLTLAGAVMLGVSLLVGYLFEPLAGAVVLGVVLLGALAVDLLSIRSERSALCEAADRGHALGQADGRRHVLLIASEGPIGDELSREIEREGEPRPVLEVLAPVLQSRSHFVTTDVDRETEAARRRLRQALDWAGAHGIEASGVVGDPIVPLAAVEDELRSHEFDEVLLITHPQEEANWVEERILERIREELRVPLKQLVIDREGHAAAPRA
jgi:hypothetical protein